MSNSNKLNDINEKWGNYKTETTKGFAELCYDFEWLLIRCEELTEENERLKMNVNHTLQYTHDEYLKDNITEDFSDDIYQLLTQK